jgi:prefoldin subunit 5
MLEDVETGALLTLIGVQVVIAGVLFAAIWRLEGRVNNRIDALEARLTALEARITALEARLDALDARLTSRLDALVLEVAGLAERVARLEALNNLG